VDLSIHPLRWTRREWLQRTAFAAAALPQGFQRGGRGRGRRTIDPSQIPQYAYRTLPVDRLPALQNEFVAARNNKTLGGDRLYLAQTASLKFEVPRDFAAARSVVVVAAYSKPVYATFRYNGTPYRVMIPFQYYDDDLNAGKLATIVQTQVVKAPNRRVVDVSKAMSLKLLAARSGLGVYGRNGLIFVNGMGSYAVLFAFLTDHQFTEDHWTELRILDECNRCHACERSCPTRCITRWSFSTNIDRCLTLFNENLGEFPNYILGSMHHALMGCMRCNDPCPVNEGIADLSGTLEEVTEDETRKILSGAVDEALLASLRRKLRQFRAVATREQFPILKRNLAALIRV
jgi:epoxyqueuosine reductase